MKVLFIGLGGAGQRLLRIFQQEVKEPVTWLAYRALARPGMIRPDFSLDESKDVSSANGLRCFKSLDEALQEEPDFAVIANPTHLHLDTALQVARAGCHFLLEKPLADTDLSINELIRVVRQRKLITMVGYQARFHPCLQWIREKLQQNAFGQILDLKIKKASYLPSWHPYEDFRKLYASRKDLGGGVVLTESHEVDYALWLFGKPVRVTAKGGNLGPFPMDVEDTAAISLEFLQKGRAWPAIIQLSFVEQPPSHSFELNTEEGHIVWNDDKWDAVHWHHTDGKVETISFPGWDRNRLFTEEVRYFLNCLRTGTQAHPNIEEAAEGLQVLLACKRSLQQGMPIPLEAVIERAAS